MRKLVLASTSPRRKDLLEMIGLSFRVAESHVTEVFNPRLRARGQAESLSLQKAEAVAIRYKDAVILGADQVISFETEVLGKPHTSENAKRMLTKLQGKTHRVITAFTIIDTLSKKTTTHSVETKVTMRRMSKKEIEWYVATGEPLDRAGSYAMQGIGALFVEKIDGDYTNVIGLPVGDVVRELQKFGVTLF